LHILDFFFNFWFECLEQLEYSPRWRIKVPLTALTLTSDLDLQSKESYGHGPYTSIRSRSKVNRFKS